MSIQLLRVEYSLQAQPDQEIRSYLHPSSPSYVLCLVAQLSPTLCDPMDCSLSSCPYSPVFLLGASSWTEEPGGLQSIRSQRPRHNWATNLSHQLSSVQLLSHVRLFVTPWTTAHQASLSITNSRSLLKLMPIESVMPPSHLILCRPLLLLPSIFPNIRVFSNESALRIRWPKYWSFSFNISPSNEHSGPISFGIGWLDFLAIQGTLKSLLQHHSSKASILH